MPSYGRSYYISSIKYEHQLRECQPTTNKMSFLAAGGPSKPHTIFCRIIAPGTEAENEPLTLLDFNESRSVDYLRAENMI